MKTRTKEALENFVVGVEHLLNGLTAEQQLRIDYKESTLMAACKELRTALLHEPTE